MQFGFKNKNLSKGICPTLAIVSNPEVRRALGSAKNNTANDNLSDNKIQTMMEYATQLLLDDNFVATDENNLLQEIDV